MLAFLSYKTLTKLHMQKLKMKVGIYMVLKVLVNVTENLEE